MVAIAAAVLVAFIGGLYFITHHKKEESEALQGNKVVGNGLPPKPEERWRYIKELESRQPGVRAPTEPSAGGEVKNADQLTDEQRQLLAQMQADMRQQPTQLNEVPWNEQTRRSVSKRCSASVRHSSKRNSSSGRRRSRYNSRVHNRSSRRVLYKRSLFSSSRKPSRRSKQHSRIRICCRRLHIPLRNSQKRSRLRRSLKRPRHRSRRLRKKDERRWMVQCGSFKGAEQAETVRAQLAFEGFDSRITTNNGWNRVVIGPVKGKENADGTISRLKVAGHTNCIRLASGG